MPLRQAEDWGGYPWEIEEKIPAIWHDRWLVFSATRNRKMEEQQTKRSRPQPGQVIKRADGWTETTLF